jgi:hypothetical protein
MPVSPVFAEIAKAIYGDGVDPRELAKFMSDSPDGHIDGPVNPAAKKARDENILAGVGLASTGLAGVAGIHAIKATRVENKVRSADAVAGQTGRVTRAVARVTRLNPAKAAAVVGGGALALHGVELLGDTLGARAQIKALKKQPQPDAQPAGVAKAFRLRPLNPSGMHVPSLRARRPRISPAAPGSLFGKSVTWTGTISKVDADKRQVFGWASVSAMGGRPVLDLQGDIVPIEETEKAAYRYVLESRKGGDMHARVAKAYDSPKHTSDLIESFVVTPEKLSKMGLAPDALPIGWWVGFHVNDDAQWAMVKSGERTGFSIHGTGTRTAVAKGVTDRILDSKLTLPAALVAGGLTGAEIARRQANRYGAGVTPGAMVAHPGKSFRRIRTTFSDAEKEGRAKRNKAGFIVPVSKMGPEVKDWDMYHALRRKGKTKESAARITNGVAKGAHSVPGDVRAASKPILHRIAYGPMHSSDPGTRRANKLRGVLHRHADKLNDAGDFIAGTDAGTPPGLHGIAAALLTKGDVPMLRFMGKGPIPVLPPKAPPRPPGRHRLVAVNPGGARHQASTETNKWRQIERKSEHSWGPVGPKHLAKADTYVGRHRAVVSPARRAVYGGGKHREVESTKPRVLVTPKHSTSAFTNKVSNPVKRAVQRVGVQGMVMEDKYPLPAKVLRWAIEKRDDSPVDRVKDEARRSARGLGERVDQAIHPPAVKLHRVASSMASKVGYQKQTRRLVYRMRNGSEYTYQAKPKVGQAATEADSTGKFYNEHIKDQAKRSTGVGPVGRARLLADPVEKGIASYGPKVRRVIPAPAGTSRANLRESKALEEAEHIRRLRRVMRSGSRPVMSKAVSDA